jgi:peptide deformylase
VKIKATGWLARIFQHEIDHLNGILFIDRAKKVWKIEEDVSQPVAAV